MTDDELIHGFEAASLSGFPHADHVRLTILYLARHGRDETERKLFEGLRRFAAAKGVPAPAPVGLAPDRRRPPRISEPWFC